MGVDIGISDDETCIYPRRDEPIVTLEDDGYFWFLHPLFEELARETGKWIDLYEAPVFVGPELKALQTTLATARRSIREQPDQWEVHVGEVADGGTRFATVEKKLFLSLLRKIGRIVARAIATNRCVAFFGD
jgi:hypothetical protein